MSGIRPLLTFKAGRCEEVEGGRGKIKCLPTEGYIFLYIGEDDELVHFCWATRNTSLSDAELDLLMLPSDATFTPYTGKEASADSDNVTSPTNGRIFALKFSSSSQRHLFWLQSPSQHPDKKANWFSPRDLKLGQIVDMLLSGEEVDVAHELSDLGPPSGGADADDMPDASLQRSNTGGAGPDATGGDIRDEGEESREGGADGGRAASSAGPADASALVRNLLNSLQGSSGQSQQQQQQQRHQDPFCSLADLMTPDTCIPIIQSAPDFYLDTLLSQLPPAIIQLEIGSSPAAASSDTDRSTTATATAISTLSKPQKISILTRVLRSPQLRQSLGSLTAAIRDGGLPMVSDALGINVANGGFVRGGSVPLGGGQAVEAFVHGVRASVEQEEEEEEERAGGGNGDGAAAKDEDQMDTA